MLGIYLDSELNWHAQINHLTKRLSKNVYLLSKLRKFVDTKHLKLFFDAHIISHLNYSSTVWDGCCNDLLININRIHRRAIKIMSPLQNTSTEIKMKQLDILTELFILHILRITAYIFIYSYARIHWHTEAYIDILSHISIYI